MLLVAIGEKYFYGELVWRKVVYNECVDFFFEAGEEQYPTGLLTMALTAAGTAVGTPPVAILALI